MTIWSSIMMQQVYSKLNISISLLQGLCCLSKDLTQMAEWRTTAPEIQPMLVLSISLSVYELAWVWCLFVLMNFLYYSIHVLQICLSSKPVKRNSKQKSLQLNYWDLCEQTCFHYCLRDEGRTWKDSQMRYNIFSLFVFQKNSRGPA